MYGLTQVLVFIESVIVKKRGGYMWIDDGINGISKVEIMYFWILKFFWIFEFLNFLWRQTPFRFESSRARDGGMWWIIFASKGGTIFSRQGTGNVFTMTHTATSSWPYMNFKFFVTSVPGGGGHRGGVYPYMEAP